MRNQQIKVENLCSAKLGTIKGKIKDGQLGKEQRSLAVDLNEDRQIQFLIKV